jgi:CheY-like chemotaxis protein
LPQPVSGPVVLLVDDQPEIVTLLHLLLEEQSYYVLRASSGDEALDVSRKWPEEIDILVTDIELGRMNGIELYRHLQKERPEAAVLFISGKADGFPEALPEARLLEKPFSVEKFVSTVKEVLTLQHYAKVTR